MALATLDPARPVVVEAESSKVGDIALPKQLWAAMAAAPRYPYRPVKTPPMFTRKGSIM